MDDIGTFKRDAGDHIKNLQRGLDTDTEDRLCSKLHGDTARALIWLIRQFESIVRKILSVTGDKGHKVLKGPMGIEIPLERGFTFRDVMSLLCAVALLYLVLKKEGVL